MPVPDNKNINDFHIPTSDLLKLLAQNRVEIARAWSQLINEHASFHPDDYWLDGVILSANLGLVALSDFVSTDSYRALDDYLLRLSEVTMRSGFESSEVTESLMLCKEAALPIIAGVYANDMSAAVDVIAALDTAVRRMVGRFSKLYGKELNRRIHWQNEQIVTMLGIGQSEPDYLALDEILHHVASGIINALQVDHCNFYLVHENQYTLIPKLGLCLKPLSPDKLKVIMHSELDIRHDAFYREVLQQKEPLSCYDVQNDPRADPLINDVVGTKSLLAVPLVIHDRVIAIAVTGTFDEHRAFTEEQVELAWNLARAAALVVENARMHEKIRYVAVLEERERLAREIHDNLAQALSIVNLQASHVEDLLKDGQTGPAQQFLREMKTMIVEAHADARDAIFSLRNGASSAEEFLPALRSYLERYQNSYGITVLLIADDNCVDKLTTEVVIQLTRIIQEALTNVRKHAAASAVSIRFNRQADRLTILVEDDGQGFDFVRLDTSKSGQVGLQIMRERAESLDGYLEVKTALGQGTCVTIGVPLAD